MREADGRHNGGRPPIEAVEQVDPDPRSTGAPARSKVYPAQRRLAQSSALKSRDHAAEPGSKTKGFFAFPQLRQPGLKQRQLTFLRNLLNRHVAETEDFESQAVCRPMKGVDDVGIGPAELDGWYPGGCGYWSRRNGNSRWG